ncbi:MAG: hypothetical protein RLZ98_1088 [Pseudomonadota bacterium]|jgi:hypothetical protein
MTGYLRTLSGAAVGALALSVTAFSATAAPGGAGVAVPAASGIVEKVHGSHCGWRRGHRHTWACNRNRSRGYRYRRDDDPERYWAPYRNNRYSDYPFWANKAFTDAEERGNGRR